MKDNGTRKRIVRIITRIDLNEVLGIMPRQNGILLRINGILGAEYSIQAFNVSKPSSELLNSSGFLENSNPRQLNARA